MFGIKTIFPLSFLVLVFLSGYLGDSSSLTYSRKSRTLLFGKPSGTFLVSSECVGSQVTVGRSYFNCSVLIADCSFSRFEKYVGSGGVIFADIIGFSLNISDSIFSNCSCTINGGAIFFRSTQNYYINRVCAFRCHSDDRYSFCSLESTGTNNISLLSTSYCSYRDVTTYSTSVWKGNVNNIYFNSSNNHGFQQTAIIYYYTTSFSSSYGSFFNNTAQLQVCVEFCYGGGTMTYSNFVGNSSPAHGVINTNGCGATVSKCIFQNNTGTLFCSVYLSMTISNCTIYHTGNYHTSQPILEVNVSKNVVTQTYDIQFFDSYYCGVFMEDTRTLKPTPLPATPYRSFDEATPYRSFDEATPYRSFGEATPGKTCNCNCSDESSEVRTIDYVMTATIYLIVLVILIILAICISRCCKANTGTKSESISDDHLNKA